jgi:uncharacterized RDD family membrane protein YckC
MSDTDPASPPGLTPYTQPASIGARFMATLVDAVLLGVGAYAVSVAADLVYSSVYSTTFKSAAAHTLLGEISASLFVLLYLAGYEASRRQGTVGKTFLRIRVTDEEGRRISALRAVARSLAKAALAYTLFVALIFAPLLLLALAAPLFLTPRHQGLHDLAAGTFVLKGAAVDEDGRPVY